MGWVGGQVETASESDVPTNRISINMYIPVFLVLQPVSHLSFICSLT